ncbi:peroxisomal membrane protein 2-like [Branchiostoma lanceolatum]|uniref:PXMP2 protein n=1 Tax=Branchiostoma lanceolatum TaxID=7740 RepID=A0A8J9YP34_BRALA|nr:PXMP2 [Branchiostoma lanceolatum]
MEKSKDDKNVVQRAFKQYILLLRRKPIITKAITSGLVSALGNILSQKIVSYRAGKPAPIEWLGVLRYSAVGTFVTAPCAHFFHRWLERTIPPDKEYASLKRLLADRILFAPPLIFVFFLVMNALEGESLAVFKMKIKEVYWTTLKMNWKVWTVFMFININYVPVQYRVLFVSMVALLWQTILASIRK